MSNFASRISRHFIAGGAFAALLGSAMLLPALAAQGTMPWSPPAAPTFANEPPNPKGPPPKLMLPFNQAFNGRSAARNNGNYPLMRTENEWAPPLTGIGPIMDDPAHPFYNNAVARVVKQNSSFRVADLNNEAAKNLKPYAIEALKKQNALTLQGRNGETRQARCWETGVPDIYESPFSWFFIQTPKEIVLIQIGAEQQVRHIFMNVPHSKNMTPSWWGESVGHYEGDTLVVDTIGLSDKTFVDGYRTPHTDQLHVVERFRVVDGGKVLDASFTVEDPGTFNKPWGARKPRYLTNATMTEDTCQAANDDRFNLGLDPVPHADTPDF